VKPVSVGIVGLGTVGGGAFNLLRDNAAEISRRTGRDIRITHVGARRDNPQYDLAGTKVSRDIMVVGNDPKIKASLFAPGYSIAAVIANEAVLAVGHVSILSER